MGFIYIKIKNSLKSSPSTLEYITVADSVTIHLTTDKMKFILNYNIMTLMSVHMYMCTVTCGAPTLTFGIKE